MRRREQIIRAAAILAFITALIALATVPGHTAEAQQGEVLELRARSCAGIAFRFPARRPAAVAAIAYDSRFGLFWPLLLDLYGPKGRLLAASRESTLPLLAFLPERAGQHVVRVTNPMPFSVTVYCWSN